MRAVNRLARRIAAFLLAAPFLTFASALAPEHVHEAGPGHDHALAHSHFGPHELESHAFDATEIEHDIDHVVWLDSAFLHQMPYRAAPIPIVLPAGGEIVPAEMHWSVTPSDDVAPVHGPPKCAQRLRGPPLLSA
jgi:hypothetical protein